MSDLNQVLAQITPCNIKKPYIFVSYSSRDRETVWRDVLQFQQNGYNVWLDEKNLDKTRDSWRDDALTAIQSRHCQLLLFYVSATSLCSQPCLRELRETRSMDAVKYHNGEVRFVAIDVEEIGDITRFCDQIHEDISEIEDEDEFQKKADALWAIREEFFKSNNDRVRVHPKNEPNRKGDYYSDIQNSFPDKTRLPIPDPETRPKSPPTAFFDRPVTRTTDKQSASKAETAGNMTRSSVSSSPAVHSLSDESVESSDCAGPRPNLSFNPVSIQNLFPPKTESLPTAPSTETGRSREEKKGVCICCLQVADRKHASIISNALKKEGIYCDTALGTTMCSFIYNGVTHETAIFLPILSKNTPSFFSKALKCNLDVARTQGQIIMPVKIDDVPSIMLKVIPPNTKIYDLGDIKALVKDIKRALEPPPEPLPFD